MNYNVGIGISNKHLHLSEDDLQTLFGEGAELHVFKELVQPGQFAAEEKVDLIGPKGMFKGVRIIGPTRPQTQVEVSMTDARILGIDAPVRESGKLEGSAGAKLVGPAGELEISSGVIIALRHIHLSPAQAEEAGLKDKDIVDVQTHGTRPLMFQDVLIRSGDAHVKEFHVDTDEGNSAGVSNGQNAEIISGPK